MWIDRDLAGIFRNFALLEAVLVQGPRQVGKSSFLTEYAPGKPVLTQLDDLFLRSRAESDPALFFSQHQLPIIVDEFQYAPRLLPEMKRLIDDARRERRHNSRINTDISPQFFLSGSNQIDIDKAVKETLAGRVSIFTLHGLSVAELCSRLPDTSLWEFLWRGGFPELYVRPELSPISYLNDYIATFIEKDITRSGGITKINEFLTVTRLLAARVGAVLNRDSLANDAGVASKTVGEWIDVLERTHIAYLLPVYSSNINSRLTKAPKIYFVDTGLVSRLQGHLSRETVAGSPHVGALFENLVVAEVVKARDHRRLPIDLSFWRTRDGEEVDLVITWGTHRLLLEAKLAIQGAVDYAPPRSARNEFGPDCECVVVTAGGRREYVSGGVLRVPIFELTDYLVKRCTV